MPPRQRPRNQQRSKISKKSKRHSFKKHTREHPLLLIHSKSIWSAINQISKTPANTLTTCFAIAMTLLLTATLLITLKTFQHLTAFMNTANQATLYLKLGLSEDAIKHLTNSIKMESIVKDLSYISSEEALNELGQQEGYNDVLNNISENPLPPVIQLKLSSTSKEDIENLLTHLKELREIESVYLDYEWLQRLAFLIKLFHRISYALSIFFSIGIVFIISHTIQGATQRNQQEINLLQLIGAPISYIRRPFLYLGTFLGLGAGLITLTFLGLGYLLIKNPLLQFLQAYRLPTSPQLISNSFCLTILISSCLLGFLGAWIAFQRYTKPV